MLFWGSGRPLPPRFRLGDVGAVLPGVIVLFLVVLVVA
jgi:hypothetical protein